MNARERFVVTCALGLAAGLVTAAPAAAAGGVSPGALDRFAVVDNRCPTFSWAGDPQAESYEVVAFALPPGLRLDQVGDHHLTGDTEVLYQRLPGGATGWTPSAEQCLAPGGRYVWFVRVQRGDEPSPWSDGRYFAVPAAPSTEELARALAVLQRCAEADRDSSEPAQAAADATTRPVSTSRVAKGGGAGGPKSVPIAPASIRGDNPDTVGELYGVVGTSASISGAGVGAANTAGGPDLVLDGSANGEVDTLLSESGIDRAAPDSETFVVRNSGGGTIVLDVEGTLEANALDCPGCVGETELASGAVNSATIADGSIIDNDLANDAVTESKIEHGAVSTTHLQNNAVTSAKIADGTVDTADLADDSVTGAEIADGSVDSAAIRSNAVTSTHIADGTITVADIDPASSIYVSRDQLYVNEESTTWDVQGTLVQDVYCNDVDDLPLTGYCDGTTDLVVVSSYEALFWTDPSYPAGWRCESRNSLGGTVTTTVAIVCISVP